MSESDVAVARGDGVVEEEECPLCLEPLPPFWDTERRMRTFCCGKCICVDCKNKGDAHIDKALAEGSYGRQEEQLNRTCPLCRARKPTSDDEVGRTVREKFEKGQLPLHLYWMLGMRYINEAGGMERNEERGVEILKGIEILKLGANKGDPICQFLIAGRYMQGRDGLPKSAAEAKRWLLAATEQGHAIAEFSLAVMMRDEGNYAEYMRYMKGSASKGFDRACYNLGLNYFLGNCGAQKSLEEAVRVVTPAAERGDAKSMGLLGETLCEPNPLVPPPDSPSFVKGMHWLQRAAIAGDQSAISSSKKLEEWASRGCFMCRKEALPEKTFLRCSRCRAAWYCSKDCQRRHWKAAEGHKQYCVKWE